jgi:hypothetical protein
VQAFLFFNASNMVRYLFIFWLKDPFNFQDDFWYLFANLWVVTFSLSSQFVYLYLPGCQPLNYFICTGQYQPPCLSTIPPKQNYSTLFLQLLSITSHLFVSIKIRLHKRKQNQSQINIEMQNLTDYITSITNLIVMCVATSFVVLFNRVQPEKAHNFPHYLIIYGFHMFVPFLVILAISLMYFIRQPKLRKTIYREMVDGIVSISNYFKN